ncbi:MAG: dUTP diphosphatase [Anaeroplasmataceae bacterium]
MYQFLVAIIVVALFEVFKYLKQKFKVTEIKFTTETQYNKNLNLMFKYNAACFDITNTSEPYLMKPGEIKMYNTGLCFDLPDDYELQIRPRSGLSSKGIQAQFGTVDPDYRGEVKITLYNLSKESIAINKGDRIAQGFINKLDFNPRLNGKFKFVFDKTRFKNSGETERSDKGFGSSGV